MGTLIVYLDDASYAQQILAPLLSNGTPSHCVLVACAPRMSRRIGKWLSHSSRENWREKWCDKLFAQITSTLRVQQNLTPVSLEYVVAKGPLPELTQHLRNHFGAAQVIDARRPKFDQDKLGQATFGQELPPVVAAPHHDVPRWPVSSTVG